MRCYDGCPDAQLQAKIDDELKAVAQLKKLGASVTYFPMEGQYMAFNEKHLPITPFCDSRRATFNWLLAHGPN